MKRRNFLLALACLGTALAIAFCLWERHQARILVGAARARLAGNAAMQWRLLAAEQDLHRTVRERLDLERAIAADGAGHSVAGSAAAGGPGLGDQASLGALRARYLAAYRASLDGDWGLLFQLLGLGPEQMAKLKDLLTQHEADDLLVQQTAQARGLDESAPEIEALDDSLDNANKAAIKALLGSADYKQFRQYYLERKVLPTVSDLAGAVAGTDQPLTTVQAQQLIGALADSSEKEASGYVVNHSIDWSQAIPRAQGFLAPAQLTALSALQQQEQSADQLKQFVSTLTSRAAGGSAP